eukprot:g5979.t1
MADGGEKRNKHALTLEKLGPIATRDTATVRTNGDLHDVWDLTENLVWSGEVWKVSRKGAEQRRLLVITDQRLVSIYVGSNKVSRSTPVPHVASIDASTTSDDVVLHVTTDFDYHVRCAGKVKMLDYLSMVWKFLVTEDPMAAAAATGKTAASKLPVSFHSKTDLSYLRVDQKQAKSNRLYKMAAHRYQTELHQAKVQAAVEEAMSGGGGSIAGSGADSAASGGGSKTSDDGGGSGGGGKKTKDKKNKKGKKKGADAGGAEESKGDEGSGGGGESTEYLSTLGPLESKYVDVHEGDVSVTSLYEDNTARETLERSIREKKARLQRLENRLREIAEEDAEQKRAAGFKKLGGKAAARKGESKGDDDGEEDSDSGSGSGGGSGSSDDNNDDDDDDDDDDDKTGMSESEGGADDDTSVKTDGDTDSDDDSLDSGTGSDSFGDSTDSNDDSNSDGGGEAKVVDPLGRGGRGGGGGGGGGGKGGSGGGKKAKANKKNKSGEKAAKNDKNDKKKKDKDKAAAKTSKNVPPTPSKSAKKAQGLLDKAAKAAAKEKAKAAKKMEADAKKAMKAAKKAEAAQAKAVAKAQRAAEKEAKKEAKKAGRKNPKAERPKSAKKVAKAKAKARKKEVKSAHRDVKSLRKEVAHLEGERVKRPRNLIMRLSAVERKIDEAVLVKFELHVSTPLLRKLAMQYLFCLDNTPNCPFVLTALDKYVPKVDAKKAKRRHRSTKGGAARDPPIIVVTDQGVEMRSLYDVMCEAGEINVMKEGVRNGGRMPAGSGAAVGGGAADGGGHHHHHDESLQAAQLTHSTAAGSDEVGPMALPEGQAGLYGAEIALAFEALHNCDVYAKDCNSEEIFLDDFGHVKLHTFGHHFYKRRGPSGEVPTYAADEVLYLAPEALAAITYGENMETAEMDYWALGVLMYEMMVGQLPFHGKTIEDMIEATHQADGSVKMPSILSWHARTLLSGLLETNPKQRLGYHGGMAEIMRHPFFSEQCRIDFTRLQPPAEGAGGAAQGKPEPLRTGVYWPTGGYQTTLSTLGLQKKTRSGTANKLRKKLQTLQRNNAIVATDASSSGGGDGGGGGGRIRRRRSSTTIMVKS